MDHGQVCHQRLCNGGLEMLDLESHGLAERLAFLVRSLTRDTAWGQKKAFSRLKSNPKAESCRKPRGEAPFFAECHKALRHFHWSTDISRSRKELYRELVVGTASDPLEDRFGWSLDEIHFQWNWAPGSGSLNNSVLARLAARSERVTPRRLGFQGGLGRHARLRSLRQWSGRSSFARLLLRASQPALESRREVDGPH